MLVLFALAVGAYASEQDPAYWLEHMRTGDSAARKEAREALIGLGGAAVPALIEATRDDDDWIRWEAVNALGAIAFTDPEPVIPAIPVLVERALTDANPHPRWRSLWALAVFPDKVVQAQVIPRLREGLKSQAPDIVWNATVALAYFRQPEAADLLNLGIHAPDGFRQWEAVYCLGMVHNAQSVSLLIEVVTALDRYQSRLRQEAANTLGKIGDPQAIPALVTALADPEPGVRWRAAAALAKCGDPSVVTVIEAALAVEEDPFARKQMREAIERLKTEVEEGL